MKCSRCGKEVITAHKVPHPVTEYFNLRFCEKCAEETGNKHTEVVSEVE